MSDHPAIRRMPANLALAEKALRESGQLETTFVLMAPGRTVMIQTPWENPDQRAIYYGLLQLFCRAEDVTAVTLIAETWIRHVPKTRGDTTASLLKRAQEIRPSQSESRREAIIAGTCYRDDDEKIQVALEAREIVRNDSGWPTGTEPFSFEDSIPFDAHIAVLLPPPDLTADDRQAARRELTMAQLHTGIYLKPLVIPAA